uniref:Uncharacterized protein n=1 Tax=Oryza sativa subsp. japonica TaxID=39947 RepID=Q6ZL62_ORYSJ|nr:hypothetical protein [Oryza sativa Japonica Group]BAD31895.1 hypothetical protein [Oryza sativa Japonica Group]
MWGDGGALDTGNADECTTKYSIYAKTETKKMDRSAPSARGDSSGAAAVGIWRRGGASAAVRPEGSADLTAGGAEAGGRQAALWQAGGGRKPTAGF